jgi:predicted glycoside hydrolase/deacetylase ChbG (UPF0249 family)
MSERTRSLAQLLGYPDDARLLIINADDFGMCHAENVATMLGLDSGAFSSATVMVPCPWFHEVVAYAQRAPTADLGVHLTQTSEWQTYKWGPVAGASAVPSLVDVAGAFYPDVPPVYDHARLDDVERETRAQIERALAAGIDVTHLDSHMGTLQLDVNYHDLYVRIAADYRLPIRMASRAWMHDIGMGHIVALADRLGVLSPDHLWVGGPAQPGDTERYWTGLFEHVKPGVNELYVHAGIDEPEGHAITAGWAQRVADYEFFTAPSTAGLLAQQRITRIGYREVRDLQRHLLAC